MRGHGRAHLQSPELTAVAAAHSQRQAQRSLPLGDHRIEWQHAPRIAARTVGCELVAVCVESGDAAEIDHGARVGPAWARRMSLQTNHAARVHVELRIACATGRKQARRQFLAISGKIGADGPLRNGETQWLDHSCC